MAYLIGGLIGGVIATFLLSRLVLLVLKPLGDRPRRVVLAHVATFTIAVFIGGYGLANGGPPVFLAAAVLYGVPGLLWLIVDLLAWKGRKARASEAAAA